MNGNCLFNRSQVAKKEHTCYLCDGTILVGERYKQLGYIDLGQFWVNKLHKHCYDNIVDYCCQESNYDHEWTKYDVLDDMYQQLVDKAKEDGNDELEDAAYDALMCPIKTGLVELYEKTFC